MRTSLTKEQVSAMIEYYFDQHDSNVNFIYHCEDDKGYSGCLVDHSCEIELPEEK